jgi:hypothetical protein
MGREPSRLDPGRRPHISNPKHFTLATFSSNTTRDSVMSHSVGRPDLRGPAPPDHDLMRNGK